LTTCCARVFVIAPSYARDVAPHASNTTATNMETTSSGSATRNVSTNTSGEAAVPPGCASNARTTSSQGGPCPKVQENIVLKAAPKVAKRGDSAPKRSCAATDHATMRMMRRLGGGG
jgi:hypothetical protein